MVGICLCFEVISIFIAGVMILSGAIITVVPNFEKDDKGFSLWIMAIMGGCIFAPYFIYIAIKYFVTKMK